MIELNRFTLPNGLRVVHNYDASTAMVAVNVVYNVGARDESPGLTGLAHLFEHLMFGGSVNIPDFDGAIERAGGMNNAWTSNDYTSFYDVVPAQNAETAFWLESDRMLSLAFTPESLEVQRSVVIEEFKQQCLNRPYGDLGHHLRSLLYKNHPYRWPVIGLDPSHIERVSMDDVKSFFDTHYAPNNAVMVVCGNIPFVRVRELAEKWFGDIPRREIAPRLYGSEALPDSARSGVAYGDVPQAMVTVAYPMPGCRDEGYIACDTLSDILASGRSSRLYRKLMMGTDLFTSVDASISGSEEPGFIMVNGRLKDCGSGSVEKALELIGKELVELAKTTVAQSELDRALNRFEANFSFSNVQFLSRAQAIASYEIRDQDINEVVPLYRRLTPEGLRLTASEIFKPEYSSTLVYSPRSSAPCNLKR